MKIGEIVNIQNGKQEICKSGNLENKEIGKKGYWGKKQQGKLEIGKLGTGKLRKIKGNRIHKERRINENRE